MAFEAASTDDDSGEKPKLRDFIRKESVDVGSSFTPTQIGPTADELQQPGREARQNYSTEQQPASPDIYIADNLSAQHNNHSRAAVAQMAEPTGL